LLLFFKKEGLPVLQMPAPPQIEGAPFPPEAFTQEVVRRRFLGRDFMIVSRPASVQHILVTNAENYVRPPAAVRVLDAPIGGGLFLAEGARWRRQRKLLAPSFSPRASPHFAARVAAFTTAMLERIEPGQVDVLTLVQDLALCVAADTLLSIDMAPWLARVRAMILRYSGRISVAGPLDLILPSWVPGPRDVRRRAFRSDWIALVAEIVAERKRHRPETPDLFEAIEADDPQGLAAQVATLLVTGSETSGAALFWSLYLLAERPELQAEIAAEAAALRLTPEHAADALPCLHLARAVVMESLRLYPSAFAIVRQARAEDDAAGVPIRRGAIVQMAQYVLHRHDTLWSAPNSFDHRRFLPHAPPPDRFAYLPFGIGQRACIGAQLAMVETTLVLAMMMRAIAIAPTRAAPARLVAKITLQPGDAAPFMITRRA
jgi:unspecific monooxygenase